MDSIRIKMLLDFSLCEHWPFTRLIGELKAQGIAQFRMNLVTGDLELLDRLNKSFYEPGRLTALRPVQQEIDPGRITLEFRRFMHCNTTLQDMMAVLASAGVQFFEVDLLEGSCSFHGQARQLPKLAAFESARGPLSATPVKGTATHPPGGAQPGIDLGQPSAEANT